MNKLDKPSSIFLLLVLMVGLAVLSGWYFNIHELKTIIPGFISMKANTAAGMILLALGSFCFMFKASAAGKILGTVFSALVVTLAVLTILEYIYNFNFHIDELLFADPEAHMRWPPGRMAPIMCLNFMFIGSALIIRNFTGDKFVKFTQGLMIIALITSLQALIGYLSGNTYSFGSAYYTQIALHTSIVFILLTTANLLNWRNEGYMKYLSGENVSGKVGRRLLLAAVVVPALLNTVQLYGVRYEVFDADFGVLIRTVGVIVCFAWMAMYTGKYLTEVDGRRAIAEQVQLVRTEELQRALVARDDLLSICSHELRTPISSMKLQTQFVKYQIEKGDPSALSPAKMIEIVNQSDRQLDRLTKLIEDMLDFSRINSGRFTLSKEEFDLHELIVNLLDSFKNQLKANQCEMTLAMDVERPVMVYWDSYRIEQLVTNLVNNAIKYGSRKPIELKIFTKPGMTGIQITDQGMGVLPEDVERIFEPYERAISVSKISGLGLGLFISKKIAEAHGGSIKVESLSGVGSTFVTLIPTRAVDKIGEDLVYGS